jgi:hypothetical protein
MPTTYSLNNGTKFNDKIIMEHFKLDLTQLTPVEEKDRVKGNWYFVCDDLRGNPRIEQYGKDSEDFSGCYWRHWLQIPPGLPGFPVAELPDEIELKWSEWEVQEFINPDYRKLHMDVKFKRIKPTLPELTIPSGTRAEQIEGVKKLLAKLETK